MSSDKRFSYPGKVQSGDIYEVFRDADDPVLNTTEINKKIDWASRSTVHRQLIEMRDQGEIRSKKAGDRKNAGEVWYPPQTIPDVPQPTPDPVKLLYRYPWLSLIVGGILTIGVGFLFFIPGFFGQGQYLGLLNRDWLVLTSFILLVIGTAMSYFGSGVLIGKLLITIVRNRL